MRFFSSIVISLLIAPAYFAPELLAQISDTNIYAPPSYNTFQPPSAGNTYVDPVFGSTVKRLTSAVETSNLDRGGNLTFVSGEYSTMNPFNLDSSRLLLLHQSYFALYSGNGVFLKALPMEINAVSEPRWSRVDPKVLYYHVGNQLKKYDVNSDARTVVRTFGEYSSISGKGESDISFDGDHMVFVGDNRYVFVYRLSNDTKGNVFDAGGNRFDAVYITPNNNVTITWLQSGVSRYNGIELFDSNMNFQRQLAHAGGHMDVTRDNGEEVLIWTNSNDSMPLANCDNGIVKIRLSDARQTCLVSLDWNLAVHISGPDNSGYVFLETYAPSNPAPGSAGWVRYTNEILQVKLDGTEVRRLVHHRSRPYDSYNYMPKVSVSRDGRQLVFASNYNLQAISGYTAEYVDVYHIDLSGAPAPAPSAAPDVPASTAPVPNPASLTISSGPLPSATQGLPFEATLAVSGGAPPYAWSVTSGSLPTGLSLSVAGSIFGVPLNSGTSTFTVQVSDSTSSSSKTLSLTVAAPAAQQPSGSSSPAPSSSTTTRIEQDGSAITYSGTWHQNSLPGHSGSSAALAMDSGARATLTFTGTAVRWFGYRDEWSGIANVYVDGELKAVVDTASSPSQYRALLYSITGLSANTHSLVVEASGNRSGASGGSWIWIDSFEVDNGSTSASPTPAAPSPATPGPVATTPAASVRVEQDSSPASYQGTWFTRAHSAFSGGAATLAMDAGSTVTYSFNGTGISWIGYQDAWSGIANVYIDGARVAQIDSYSPSDKAQSVIYNVAELSPGAHTIKIEAAQQKSSSSLGYWIWVDAFEVKP